jgi:hypothetical protein
MISDVVDAAPIDDAVEINDVLMSSVSSFSLILLILACNVLLAPTRLVATMPFGDDADNLFGVDLVGDLGDGDEVEEGEKEGEETAL